MIYEEYVIYKTQPKKSIYVDPSEFEEIRDLRCHWKDYVPKNLRVHFQSVLVLLSRYSVSMN